MVKMMTLMDAWKLVPLKKTIGVEDAFAHGFAAGRVGMIPEDETVRIPPVSEWPNWAVGIEMTFTQQDSLGSQSSVQCKKLLYIPRPTPAWVPQDWEPVIFAKPEDDTTLHGVYFKGEIHFGDIYYTASGMRYAKFDASKIGKPWDEIPGGVE